MTKKKKENNNINLKVLTQHNNVHLMMMKEHGIMQHALYSDYKSKYMLLLLM